jgi:hypothetical protein
MMKPGLHLMFGVRQWATSGFLDEALTNALAKCSAIAKGAAT